MIKFHGFQTNPKPFYVNSHCVILPSYHEGMSNVLLEAAATGRALIASDIPGGGADTVEEGVNGFLCRKKDAEDLERCVERFMRLSMRQRELMGKKGRRKMEREFDKAAVVGETVRAIGG